MERMEIGLEQNRLRLNISFSLKDEIERVETTLNKHEWYKTQGYNLSWPSGLASEKADGSDIQACVEKDFDPSLYEEMSKKIEKEWEEKGVYFFEKAKSFGLLIQPEYQIYLTRYGVGGSYCPPNQIIIKFHPNYSKIESLVRTIFHEIIHLAIEQWIQEYDIPHWTKERLVDLTFGKIFNEKDNLQRDPENSERVEQTFNSYFPDMKRVIVELSTKEK